VDVALSLIIPARDEARRLPPYLRAIRDHFDGESGDYEVIVVDDGSRDDSLDVLGRLGRGWRQLSVLSHTRNLGKGAAVRTGMLAARGEFLLFADADGATPIGEEAKLRSAIAAGADLAVASRFSRAPGVSRRRTPYRGLGGRAFALVARRLLRLPVHDTQCGFKMFRRRAGLRLVNLCRQRGYLLDAELIGLAAALGYRIAEVPVCWADVPGSKVRPLRDACRMLVGLLAVRRSVRAHVAAEAAGGGILPALGDAFMDPGLGPAGGPGRPFSSPRTAEASR
jgi:dolichyl-phosphate beta-glucosyltransferase